MNEARIDKWLWAARIFKTRSMAAAACKKGQVSMKGAQLKPSRTVKPGDVIEVRKPPVTYSFKVKQTIEKRVGAKLIPEILENVTPPEQYELLEMSRLSGFVGRAVEPDALRKKTAGAWRSSPHPNIWTTCCSTSMSRTKKAGKTIKAYRKKAGTGLPSPLPAK